MATKEGGSGNRRRRKLAACLTGRDAPCLCVLLIGKLLQGILEPQVVLPMFVISCDITILDNENPSIVCFGIFSILKGTHVSIVPGLERHTTSLDASLVFNVSRSTTVKNRLIMRARLLSER